MKLAPIHSLCIAPPYLPGVPPCPGHHAPPLVPPFVPVLPVEPEGE